MSWYLFLREACSSCFLCIWLTLWLSSSQNSLSLVIPPILPVWLPANQHFIKLIQVANLYSVQDHCTTAVSSLIFTKVQTILSTKYFSVNHSSNRYKDKWITIYTYKFLLFISLKEYITVLCFLLYIQHLS